MAAALTRPSAEVLCCGQATCPLQSSAAPFLTHLSSDQVLAIRREGKGSDGFPARNEVGSKGHWQPGLSLAPSQPPQEARPADNQRYRWHFPGRPGGQPHPHPQSHRDPRQRLLTAPGRCSPRAQTHLPGTVEDVVLFVFPGIEQHDHTPGEMRKAAQLQHQAAAPPGAPGSCSDRLTGASLVTEGN